MLLLISLGILLLPVFTQAETFCQEVNRTKQVKNTFEMGMQITQYLKKQGYSKYMVTGVDVEDFVKDWCRTYPKHSSERASKATVIYFTERAMRR